MNAVGVSVETLRAVSADEWPRIANPGLPPCPFSPLAILEVEVEQRQQIGERCGCGIEPPGTWS